MRRIRETLAWSRAVKVSRKMRQEGPWKTFRYLLNRLSAWVRTARRERQYGISTAKRISNQDLGRSKTDYACYSATEYETFEKVMQHVPVRKDQDVFVDVGSGKGRIVILAARYPFKKVIGVELYQALNEIARENIQAALANLTCKDIEIVETPAEEWVVPPEVNCFFFFNPFKGKTLVTFMSHIRESLKAAPRKITIIYIRPNLFFEKDVAWQEWLDKKVEFSCAEDKVAVYVNREAV